MTLCGTVPYVFRKRLDLFFHGRTKRLSLFEQALIFVPIAVCTWALTRQWIVLFFFIYLKFVFSMSLRLDDLIKGESEVFDVSNLAETEETELSLRDQLRKIVHRRRSAHLYEPVVSGRRTRSSGDHGRR